MQTSFLEESDNVLICAGDDGTYGGWCLWDADLDGVALDSGLMRMSGDIWSDVLNDFATYCPSTADTNTCIQSVVNLFYS